MSRKFKNKDLADRLGVSSTLVSLVLNGKADLHGIRKDTQERVLSLARQMGFFDTPQDSDKSVPVEEKPGIIGMIVPTLNDHFIFEIAPHLQKAFSGIGVGFSIITRDPDDERYNRLVASFKKFYSGLILSGEAADDYTIRALRSTDYPMVLLEKSIGNLRLNTVTTDISAGVSLMAGHIEKFGYKNALILTRQKAAPTDALLLDMLTERFSQLQGMNNPIIDRISLPLVPEEFDSSSLEKYLRPPLRIDLIVVLNSELVYPVLNFLQRKKIRVPQDIALVSMEDGFGFDLLHTPVTALRRPLSAMAIKAANIIWTEVKNEGKSKFKRQVHMPPELIVRKSCGSL